MKVLNVSQKPNVYARAGMWDSVEDLLKEAEEGGVDKRDLENAWWVEPEEMTITGDELLTSFYGTALYNLGKRWYKHKVLLSVLSDGRIVIDYPQFEREFI